MTDLLKSVAASTNLATRLFSRIPNGRNFHSCSFSTCPVDTLKQQDEHRKALKRCSQPLNIHIIIQTLHRPEKLMELLGPYMSGPEAFIIRDLLLKAADDDYQAVHTNVPSAIAQFNTTKVCLDRLERRGLLVRGKHNDIFFDPSVFNGWLMAKLNVEFAPESEQEVVIQADATASQSDTQS